MNLSIRTHLINKYQKNHYIKGLNSSITAGICHRIIKELQVTSLTCFEICTLVEVFELPLSLVWQEIDALTQVTESLLHSFSHNKPLQRHEATWLGFQIAYLQALQNILDQEANLQKPWFNRAIVWSPDENDSIFDDTHLQGLLKTLRPGKLTDTQAEQALLYMADSLFVQQINHTAIAWFIANGAQETEAKLIVQRLTNGLSGYLLAVVAKNATPLARLQKFVQLGILSTPGGNNGVTAVTDKIDFYRELYRATLLQNQAQALFIESFALKDIYVPLKGLPIETINLQSEPKKLQLVDLMVWVQKEFDNLESITVIESAAGYGKTSFCQILAAKLAQEFYPSLMPILIRLRDVSYSEDLIETLNSGFAVNSQIHFSDWLKIRHLKLILILDGLDELPFNCNQTGKIKFIQSLLKLQSQTQHKIVLTSRSPELQNIEDEIIQLRRIAIAPFEREELQTWFQNWSRLESVSTAKNLFTFLKQAGLFSLKSSRPELATLIRQPLTLYLLGILHRDGLLDDEIFKLSINTRLGNVPILWEMYQRLHRFLLRCSLNEAESKPVSTQVQSHHLQELAQIHKQALLILHSQCHYIYTELEPNSLTAFYFDSSNSISCKPINTFSKIEFLHPKSEFIVAEAIVTELKLLIEFKRNAYGEYIFTVDSITSVAQHLYKLFGFGILSQEIAELVIEGLRRVKTQYFSFERLCDRLLQFWYSYCQGRWLDEGIAHNTWSYFQDLQNPINVEQINAAVGLNLFFLLSDCHREAKSWFFPCRNPSNYEESKPEILLELINRSTILAPHLFQKRINSQSLAVVNLADAYLTQVVLTQVDLEAVNLTGANLTGANLAGTNLANANLANANLTGANLTNTNLTGTNLTGANLAGANLIGAKIESAILTNACLYNIILTDANQEMLKFKGAIFVLEEWKAFKRLLLHQSQLQQSQVNSDTLYSNAYRDIWFCNIPQMGLIESIEGEISSEDLYEDEADDETVIGTF